MQRLPRIESTNDKEKRRAFKEQLANKISGLGAEPVFEEVEPTVFNGVPIGGTLYHPSLGPGTLISFSAAGGVILEFASGMESIAYQKALGFLSPLAPKVSKIDTFEPATFGPDPVEAPVRPESAVRPVANKPEEKKVPVKPTGFAGIDIGGTLYHPDLGPGKLVSVTDGFVTLEFTSDVVEFSTKQAGFLSPVPPSMPARDTFESAVFGEVPKVAPPVRPPGVEIAVRPEVNKPKPSVAPAEPTEFVGVEVGGTIYHPTQGAGTLISVSKTEVAVQFPKGVITFGYRNAQGYLTATMPSHLQPVKPDPDGAFFGEEIKPMVPVKPPTVELAEFHKPTNTPTEKRDPVPGDAFVVGEQFYHPSLGVGLVLAVVGDLVTLGFDTGPESFSVRSGHRFLSPVIPEPEAKVVEDPFFDDVVLRDLPHQPVAHRHIEDETVSSSSNENNAEFIHEFVGHTVWHPDLGLCLVSMVDVSRNEIILESKDGEIFPCALRSVESKLVLISPEEAPESGRIHRH